jgi:hypothetical protein
MAGWLMNDEMQKIWNEAAVFESKYSAGIWLEGPWNSKVSIDRVSRSKYKSTTTRMQV